jgi:hypothetical protein
VEVLWKGTPYEARILKVDGDFHWITYPGWPSYWDEWVMSDRIVASGRSTEAAMGNTEGNILVEWEGSWYPAIILKQEGDRYLIHYTGYNSSWDEWVTRERMR